MPGWSGVFTLDAGKVDGKKVGIGEGPPVAWAEGGEPLCRSGVSCMRRPFRRMERAFPPAGGT